MPLLSDADRTTLVQHLAPIGKQVDLLLFTQTIGGSESGERIEVALDLLARHDLAATELETDTGGRPAERPGPPPATHSIPAQPPGRACR